MNKRTLIIAILGILLLLVVIGLVFITIVRPSLMAIGPVKMSDSTITIQLALPGSAMGYIGRWVSYRDESLYITVIGSVIPLPFINRPPYITINNTYGKVKAIYIAGSGGESDRMIWPSDDRQQAKLHLEKLIPVEPGGTTTQQ